MQYLMKFLTRHGFSWRLLAPALVLVILAGVACGSTAAPETTAPESTAPDTAAPESTVPDTAAPDTKGPDTALRAPTAVPEAVTKPTEAMVTVNPGKVTVMVSSLGNERYDKTVSSGADKNQGRLIHGLIVATNEKTELIPGLATE